MTTTQKLLWAGSATAVAALLLAAVALVGAGGFMAYQFQTPANSAALLQAEDKTAWGEAVEGVQVRLRAKETNWNEDAVPRLFVDVRNQGRRQLLIRRQMNGCELEVDGRWFLRPANTRELRPLPSPFPPGRQYDNIVIDLDGHWQEAGEAQRRLGRIKRLELAPGKHTVRVAVTAAPDKNDPGRPLRAISKPVMIEIAAGRAKENQSKNSQ